MANEPYMRPITHGVENQELDSNIMVSERKRLSYCFILIKWFLRATSL